ncbi:MAG: 50S ribosomal protein L10 [Bacteriovoracaceae bacterium]|nr:50S ribosomal protein L10 [Bacteriovoracaceae bacterium]
MIINKAKKEELVSNIRQNLDKAKGVFVTNLVGIEANKAVQIRKEVREAGGVVMISRNTLFARASQGTPYEKILSGLKGSTAVAFAFEDPVMVAKVLFDASKENEVIHLNSGFLGDKELSKAEVATLAKLPSRNQMLATLLATFNAPVSAFVRVLDSIRKKKEEGGSASA